MDIASGLRLRHLPHRGVLRMVLRSHGGLAVFEGRLWITQDGDRRDHIVDAGETFWSGSEGEILVQALADSKFVELDAVSNTDARPSAAPARRPSAYELTRVMRDMRYREVARSLARAAGAASYLLQATWQLAARVATETGIKRTASAARGA